LEQERLAAKAETARLEAQQLEQERLAEEARLEAEGIEQEKLAAEEARLEDEHLEQERVAAEQDRLEGERLKQDRLAAEAATTQAELERLEQEQIERERILAEEAEAHRLEQERLAAEQEIGATKAEESDEQGQQELQNESDKQETKPGAEVGWGGDDEMGDLYDDDELDDMYGDDEDSDDEIAEDHRNDEPNMAEESPVEESTPTEQVVENDHDNDTSTDEKPPTTEDKPAEKVAEDELKEPAPAEPSFFDAAAAVTSTSTSLQSMFDTTGLFEASNTASMFSWGYNNDEATPAAEVVSASEPVMGPITEKDTGNVVQNITPDSNEAFTEATGHDKDGKNDTSTVQLAEQAGDENSSAEPTIDQQSVPQHTLDNFMKQLERMTESHQLEMDELQRSHKIEIDRVESELLNEREMKKKANARDEVASQDKFLKQMRELEKKFSGTIRDQENKISEAAQRNEGMSLQMDTLKREVDGLTKLVDERDEEICRLNQGHGNTMMHVEGQVKTSQVELSRKDNEIYELRNSVSSLQTDLDTTADAYNTLKARAKTIATELKDRRIEVRNLSSQNEELASSNASFETQLTNLRALVNQHELTIVYKDKDMEELNEKMKELNKQISQGNVKSVQDRSVGEKAISSYKRKAQEALAAANARLAAANQARDEAESDAKNARSASDDAVERARVAEMKRSESEQKANEANGLLESERLASSENVNNLKETVDNLKETINSLQSEVDDAAMTRAKLVAELEQLNSNLTEQKEKNSDFHERLIESNSLCESLQREVQDLNDEVQRSSAAAFKRAKDSGEGSIMENHADRSSANPLSLDSTTDDREESDGTIIMLQQELQGANEAIEELKLALRSTLLEKADSEYARDKFNAGGGDESFALQNEVGGEGSESKKGNESTPLFFAIEKQNELKTARDEINRLANMLGDAECSKQEAYDAMEAMRHNMEEANSRLLRYEKLGMKSSRPQMSHSSYGPFRNTSGSSVLNDDTRMVHSGNDSTVNLEYLKNVMLSFLTATTLADRRKLVPVVATVLCLTPEEQAQAINSVESNAGLTGVATSFWENIESKAHNFL